MPRAGDVNTEYVDKLLNIGLSLSEPFKGAKIHHKLLCNSCNHEWVATPISKIQSNKKYGGNGCPECTKIKKEVSYVATRSNKLEELADRGIVVLSDYDGRLHSNHSGKILVRNTNCGHEFNVNPSNLIHGVNCPTCNTVKKREQFREWGKIRQQKYLSTASDWQKYKSEVYSITRLNYKTYSKTINPKKCKQGRAGIPGAYQLDHVVPVRYCFDNNIPANICAHPQNLQMLPWEANLEQKAKLKKSIPPIFHKYIDSSLVEQDFVNNISTITFSETYSDILFPYTTSVWFPHNNCAVLFCPIGEYVEQRTNNRNIINDVLVMAKTKNIRCIVVYEDEWFFNKDIVTSKITHICKQSLVPMIHARKCVIKVIDDKVLKSTFLDSYHIQGNDRAQVPLGAFYDNELVGVMTFGKPRIGIGSNSTEIGVWELSRFATTSDYRIPGIASKLLKHFTRNYDWTNIYSFADRRWSIGNVYGQLGFTETTINPADYHYIVDGKRMHRWNYRKDVIKQSLPIYDDNLTEYQNMLNNGYDRVWGAGTIRYELNNEKQPS